jgi:hypothetical protein
MKLEVAENICGTEEKKANPRHPNELAVVANIYPIYRHQPLGSLDVELGG